MKTVSILGCGWLGKPLAVFLTKQDYHLKGSTTSEKKLSLLESLNIEPYLVDIENIENFDLFLKSEILIIAITSKSVEAYRRLIEQIENSTIQKVIFISSTSVYPRANSIMTEKSETVVKPLTEIENLFRVNTHFDTTIIRFAGLYGGERHPGNWFRNGRKIPQPNGFVNMIHQEDCINIIHEVIKQNCWREIFNACSNHHPTRKEFYINARKSRGIETSIFEETSELKYKIISSQKLQEVLNYQFIHDNLLEI